MGNRPIQLDRILTIVYREDTGQIDSQGHPILRDATKAIWARRQSFQAGRDLQSYALPIGQELRQAFVVRESALAGIPFAADSSRFTEADGKVWTVEDYGPFQDDSVGGSREGYLQIVCSSFG